jgi:hypothetical protein
MLLEAVVAALVGLAGVWLVLQPLLRQGRRLPQPVEPLDPEETPKGVALTALKEIDFDRETGKLSEDDYQFLKAKYTAAALEALRHESSRTGADGIEEMIAAKVRTIRSTGLVAPPRCRVCGPRPEPDAVFCSSCGVRLNALAAEDLLRPGSQSAPIQRLAVFLGLLALGNTPLPAQTPSTDTAFAALQERGREVMGVDQYTSAHQFEDLADGGRIVLQRDSSDTAGVRTIREHLRGIARSFAAGDFQQPGLVHAQEVPGTKEMVARPQAIHYRFKPLAGGGEVRIKTRDPKAVEAIHAFLAFQRHEHRVSGSAHTH